ncbi:hypothetical protein LBUL_1564 [Lactobacillus delbrueckii subsp. bulgaricus ATCC BAA-365]|nr:hypothetical protein LBUL_1564 [Lactobacillus delbrueckii subsp. bulgaricus ATCC BAA-365]
MVLINWVKLAESVALDRSIVGISADSSQFNSFLLDEEDEELQPQAVKANAAVKMLPAAKKVLVFFMLSSLKSLHYQTLIVV